MEKVDLCFLLLLLLFPEAPWADEMCHRWTEGVQEPVEVFHCPTQEGGAGTNFCCGTCYAPYCCSSRDAQLDQDQCSGSGQLKVDSPHMMTNISSDQEMDTSLVILIAAFLVLGVVAIVFLDVFLCCCTILYFLRTRDEAQQQEQGMEDADASPRQSGHDSSPPRGLLFRLKNSFENLSERSTLNNNQSHSYRACVDQGVLSSAEDTAAPQKIPNASV